MALDLRKLPLRTRDACIAIGVAVALLFAGSMSNPFVFDDLAKIVHNPDIQDLGRLPATLVYPYTHERQGDRNDPSRPLVYTVWALVHAELGYDQAAFRLVNVLLHALTAMLLFAAARRLLARMLGRDEPWGALLAALLFAAAPVQAGTVIYVYGLSDVMSAFFIAAGLWLYVRRDEPSRRGVAACAGAFLAALLSKQSAVVFPLLVLLADAATAPGPRPWPLLRRRAGAYALLAAIGAAYLFLRLSYFGSMGDLEGSGHLHDRWTYLAWQPRVILGYLGLAVWPFGLSIDHAVDTAAGGLFLDKVLPWTLALLALGAALYLRARRGAWGRVGFFGVLFYALCLAPTSSVLPTVDLMVERRVYLADFGLFLLAGAAAGALLGRGRAAARTAATVGACALLLFYGLRTVQRNAVFSTTSGIWEEALAVDPGNHRARVNLAHDLMRTGSWREARAAFARVVEEDPGDGISLYFLFQLHASPDKGLLDGKKAGEYRARAIAALQKAAAADPADRQSREFLAILQSGR